MSYLQAAAAAFLLLGFSTVQSTSAEEQVKVLPSCEQTYSLCTPSRARDCRREYMLCSFRR
jgi:hypothetical protein